MRVEAPLSYGAVIKLKSEFRPNGYEQDVIVDIGDPDGYFFTSHTKATPEGTRIFSLIAGSADSRVIEEVVEYLSQEEMEDALNASAQAEGHEVPECMLEAHRQAAQKGIRTIIIDDESKELSSVQ